MNKKDIMHIIVFRRSLKVQRINRNRKVRSQASRSSTGLVPDMVGEQPNSDASESCTPWGTMRDPIVLFFFNPGARGNFMTSKFAAKLGICAEEMKPTGKTGLASPSHTEHVTPS